MKAVMAVWSVSGNYQHYLLIPNAAKHCKMLLNTAKMYKFVANGYLRAVSPMNSSKES